VGQMGRRSGNPDSELAWSYVLTPRGRDPSRYMDSSSPLAEILLPRGSAAAVDVGRR